MCEESFSMNSIYDVLDAAKAYCKERLVDATYNLYIDGLEPVSFENSNHFILGARSDFIAKIINDRYLALLTEAFQQVLGFTVEMEVCVLATFEEDEPKAIKVIAAGNYEFNFENFIKGPSNQFAYAAAQAVASNPSGAYNPLFIYGPSGLGKTHLLKAIEIEIHKNHPDYRIIYVDCEFFTNELINAIRSGTTENFRMKYRAADVLLVDDIQFIAGKESTQEEFFHTFNTLHNAGKQIVLACDRPAKEIKSLEERLRTRFEWGLTADIQAPTFETRVAIIKRKADLLRLDLPDDVAEYIANNLKNNIRQLEGTVKKLNAYLIMEGIEPCISVAQTCIKDILGEIQPIPVTVERIISEVGRTYDVSPEDIRSTKRNANISNARRVAMFCIREITGMSMENIGREFGRDHSTVIYSLEKTNKDMAKDSRLKETIYDIIENVKN